MSEPSENDQPPPRADRTFDSADDSAADSGDASREGYDTEEQSRLHDASQTKARRVRKVILVTILIIVSLIVLIPFAICGYIWLACSGAFR